MLSEATAFWNTIKGKVESVVKELTGNCFRCERYDVTTAPNGSVIGLTLPLGSTEIFVPYSAEVSNAEVGDTVLVVWWKTMSNAKAYYFGNGFKGSSGGGGGTDDYDELENRPKINSNLLTGDKTSQQLGLADYVHSHSQYALKTEIPDGNYWCTYGVTTYNQVKNALIDKQIPCCLHQGIVFTYFSEDEINHYIYLTNSLAQNEMYIIVDGNNNWGRADVTTELVANKVTSLSPASTDTEYPTAKCVYDESLRQNKYTSMLYALTKGAWELIRDTALSYKKTAPNGSCSADIKSYGGQNIVLNQILYNAGLSTSDGWRSTQLSRASVAVDTANREVTLTKIGTATPIYLDDNYTHSYVKGHKLFIGFDIKTDNANNPRIDVRTYAANSGQTLVGPFTLIGDNEYHSIREIITVPEINSYQFTIRSNSANWSDGNTLTVKNLRVFDLTVAFGTDNEPTDVDDVRLKFLNDYITENPDYFSNGEMITADVTKIVSKTENDSLLGEINIPTAIRQLDGYGWSAKNVYNEVDFANKKYIQRVGRVNLGSLNYTYTSQLGFATTGVSKRKAGYIPSNAISDYYEVYPNGAVTSQIEEDEATSTNRKIYFQAANTYLRILNRDYTDPTAFKTAMQGVYLYYELATPIETDISDLLNGIETNLVSESSGTVTFQQLNYSVPVPNTTDFYANNMGDIQSAISTIRGV